MPPFASHLNFLDQQLTEDGRPYGPTRYKQIVKECYVLTRKLHTSYTDLLKISPTERQYLIEFLQEEIKAQNDMIKKAKAEREKSN